MRTKALSFLLLVAPLASGCGGADADAVPATPAPSPAAPVASAAPVAASPWHYPPAKTSNASDTYFGKNYPDPFRPLENLKDPDTAAWFKAEANLTDGLLDRIPGRDKLVEEWVALDKLKPAKYRGFRYEAGKLFYKKTLGGESVGKIFVREGWGGKEQLLFDPATYKSAVANEGKVTTVESATPSWDGKYVALRLSSGGAEYAEIRILDVARKTLLADSLYPTFDFNCWTPDGRGFLYMANDEKDIRSPTIEQNVRTKLHELGRDIASDKVVFGSAHDPELGVTPKEFAGAFIDQHTPGLLFANPGTVQNEQTFYVAPSSELAKEKVTWQPVSKAADNIVRGYEVCGPDAICAVTHTGAARYKVVRTRLHHADWAHAETILPEAADSIQSMTRSKNKLLITYSNGVTGRLVSYDLATNKAADIALPASGEVNVTCPDPKSNHCLVTLEGWITPRALYDLDGDRNTVTKSPAFNNDVVYPGYDRLVAEEVEVKGHDGTMIPLSIVHEKDMPMDGSRSCILDGYGAYGFSNTPYFTELSSLALHGVVLAFAHPRGGSEKGQAWYEAGKKTTKPNTWKDFISSAEYLVEKGYTSKEHLSGTGTSAGGILISRAITERPDLFAAAVCNVGVANALRAEFSPNGPINTPEFGTVTVPEEAAALYEMDGVQHVKPGTKYPAVLGVAGWNDPRVAPWEPGKLIAALQVANASSRPELLKVNYDNGHFTEEKTVAYKNFASQAAFLLWQTGHEEFQPAR
jgi:prolyl oligopeptidase